jgi:hypothetical protein
MQLDKGIILFATEEARKKWDGKELPKKNKKSSCPSCEIEALKNKSAFSDINLGLKEEDLYDSTI